MKTINFVPACCKGEGATHEGSVTLRLPTFDEKFDYIEQLQAVKDGGDIEAEQMQKLRSIRSMVKMSKAHYVEVSLKNKATGEEVKSFDEMQYCDDLHAVLMEVAGHLVNGFKVGNG
jgi:hypothetical protein